MNTHTTHTIDQSLFKVVRDHAINHIEGWVRLYLHNGAVIEHKNTSSFEEAFWQGRVIKAAEDESLGLFEGDEPEALIARAQETL